jgi:hypothetical protein
MQNKAGIARPIAEKGPAMARKRSGPGLVFRLRSVGFRGRLFRFLLLLGRQHTGILSGRSPRFWWKSENNNIKNAGTKLPSCLLSITLAHSNAKQSWDCATYCKKRADEWPESVQGQGLFFACVP